MKIAAGKWPEAKALLLGFEKLVAEAGFGLLTPMAADYLNMTRLPDIPGHRDPLDKLIIAMALARDLVLISSDVIAMNYTVRTLLAGRARPPSTTRTRERIMPVEPLVAIEVALGIDPQLRFDPGRPSPGYSATRHTSSVASFSAPRVGATEGTRAANSSVRIVTKNIAQKVR